MEYKTFRFNIEKIEEKSSSDKCGLIKGYASTFGNVDLGDDMVERGAFLKTIDKYQKEGDKIPMCFQHSLMHIIGGFDPSKMREDDKGLHVEGEICKKTSMGADVYELAKQGILNKMSIGYMVNNADYDSDYADGKTIRRLKDISLYEISMVAHPMDPLARVNDVKSEKVNETVSVDQFISIISNREMPLNEKKSLVSQILRKNVLSRNAADYIMSFIFKESKKLHEKEVITPEASDILSQILGKYKQSNYDNQISLVVKELKSIIK
jgi:HK97 family phage prohead protease